LGNINFHAIRMKNRQLSDLNKHFMLIHWIRFYVVARNEEYYPFY